MTSQVPRTATTHKVYLILLRRWKAFHWWQNRFEILQHIKNSGEGFHPPQTPHTHTATTTTTLFQVGVWDWVNVRGLRLIISHQNLRRKHSKPGQYYTQYVGRLVLKNPVYSKILRNEEIEICKRLNNLMVKIFVQKHQLLGTDIFCCFTSRDPFLRFFSCS